MTSGWGSYSLGTPALSRVPPDEPGVGRVNQNTVTSSFRPPGSVPMCHGGVRDAETRVEIPPSGTSRVPRACLMQRRILVALGSSRTVAGSPIGAVTSTFTCREGVATQPPEPGQLRLKKRAINGIDSRQAHDAGLSAPLNLVAWSRLAGTVVFSGTGSIPFGGSATPVLAVHRRQAPPA